MLFQPTESVQLIAGQQWVTVFEKADRIGGLIRYGIPNFKLEKHILDRRIEQIQAEGVKFVTSAHIGKNVPIEDLRRDYDVVLLARISHSGSILPWSGGAEVPGE